MGTNCAPLVADLFLFCYERAFMKSLSRGNQADIIEAFNSTSRYLDDLLNIDNIYFDQMVDRIYPTELQLNRTNSSDTEAPFLDLNLCISNGTVSTKIYYKLRLPRLGKRELLLVLFVRLFSLCLFRFVGFLFLLGSGKGCGL